MAITHLTDADFAAGIAQGTTLVDFWAEWCGPCKMLAPVLEELAEETKSGVKFAKLDTDANEDTAIEYGITGIPTVIIFRDGVETERFLGVKPKSVYVQALS
ncbi:MAG: thioredoxin [Oscillospiraceae bacterium]|jgi:thioredoxin 1|nr:thioredoxin [Oscillospiraceae bacterium]